MLKVRTCKVRGWAALRTSAWLRRRRQAQIRIASYFRGHLTRTGRGDLVPKRRPEKEPLPPELATRLARLDPWSEELNFRHACLGQTGTVHLAPFIKCLQSLQILELCGNYIGSKGIAPLVKMLETQWDLKYLGLAWNGLGDESCRHLADKQTDRVRNIVGLLKMSDEMCLADDEKPEALHRSRCAVPGLPLRELQDQFSPPECEPDDLPGIVARNHDQVMQKLRRQELLLNELLVRRPGSRSMSTPPTPKPTDVGESPATSSRSSQSRLHRPRRPSGGSFTPTLFVSYTEQDLEVKAGASEVHGTTIRRKFASMRVENPTHTATTDSILSRSCRGVYRTIAAIVHSTFFDAFFTLVVIANTAFIGLDVQYTIWNDGIQPAFFYVGNYVFSTLFAVELFLRLYVERWALYCGEDWMWGWLDTFIVLTALWDIVVDVWMASQQGAESVADMSGLRAFRIIRITRIVKAVRLMRIFRFVMALRMLVGSIVNTLKSLFWALVLGLAEEAVLQLFSFSDPCVFRLDYKAIFEAIDADKQQSNRLKGAVRYRAGGGTDLGVDVDQSEAPVGGQALDPPRGKETWSESTIALACKATAMHIYEDNNEDDDQRDDNDNKETTKNDVPATAWDEMQDTSKGKEPDEKLAYQVPLPNKPANCDEAAKLGYLRLILIVYVFGVIFSQAVNDFLQDQEPDAPTVTEQGREVLQARFGTVLDAMLSLFMSITNGISYVELLTPLAALSGLWIFVFLFYMSFTYFAVLNVVTGVFCHSAIESAQNDHAAVVQNILENKESHMRKLRQLFSKFNAETGSDELDAIITFPMFEEKINTPAVREYFESLNLALRDRLDTAVRLVSRLQRLHG
ncbi:Sodium channel protein type 8 subunit alpha [Symbiodinium microadriaticum]|uniref:Sodium channel protein type 8 subunit alpha n=1 Tax=Symbiodinium microadriaticum TaxID=2951 RepID=A0A1Q9CVR3_SYMMI|nr:Sodium channel protein type 8 subunit alpha [Symbiodinium microadriaticum]